MPTDWTNWMGDAFNVAAAVSVEQGALAYLMVSLLGPLSWMFVVEICRRAHKPESGSKGQLGQAAPVRLAMPLARLARPVPPGWWPENDREPN
jgi:hypothetical protein